MTQAETTILINLGAELEHLRGIARILIAKRGRGPRWRDRLGRLLDLLLSTALQGLTAEIQRQIGPAAKVATPRSGSAVRRKRVTDGEKGRPRPRRGR